ncbi:2-oxo acid dehydrogenase subunit E2 [Streptomyces sp. NPDC047042]|uniref:2-oxo acid dehydrogenase subunit E2 n=1 Tax=Streptomyces sp. NPDC047042 TaxID=3154807 RepID=UPI0033C0A72C
MSIRPVRARRHTLYFLEYAAGQRPVFLDTEVDMTRVTAHRQTARTPAGGKFSLVSYVLLATGRVLARHPEANAVMAPGWPGRLRAPKIAHFPQVTAKLALDRHIDGQRSVLSALLPDLEQAGLAEIQERVDRYRGQHTAELPEFARLRRLDRLPAPLGRLAFAAALRDPRRRAEIFGTVSVSSLGHQPVHGFHSTGGTALTVCLGQVAERPTVKDGALAVAPLMRLSLAFDHRVVDGATAAEVLGDLRHTLEEFDADSDSDTDSDSDSGLRGAAEDQRPVRLVGRGPR